MASRPITAESVVPISSIFDALEGVLSEAERQALLTQLIDVRADGVAPGDLITAEMFNQILSDINDLKIRMAGLESVNGAPVIDRIEPTLLDKEVGTRISIFGRNLNGEAVGTEVLFDDISIRNFFRESDESRIDAVVPPSLSGLPKSVNVQVRTQLGASNVETIRVIERVIANNGSILVRNQGDPLDEIETGTTITLNWRVISQLNFSTPIQFEPIVENVVGSTAVAWRNRINLTGDLTGEFREGSFRDIGMVIDIPDNAESAGIGLRASTPDGSFSEDSDLLSLVVGEAPLISDPRAAVGVRAFNPTTALRFGNIVVGGRTIPGFRMAPNSSLSLPMQLSTIDGGGGRYTFDVSVEGQNDRWSISPVDSELNMGSNETQPFSVPLSSNATSDTGTVSFLIITANHQPSTGSAGAFSSFARIPIVGL